MDSVRFYETSLMQATSHIGQGRVQLLHGARRRCVVQCGIDGIVIVWVNFSPKEGLEVGAAAWASRFLLSPERTSTVQSAQPFGARSACFVCDKCLIQDF